VNGLRGGAGAPRVLGGRPTFKPSLPQLICTLYELYFYSKKLIFFDNSKIKGSGLNILIEKESNYVYFL